MKAMKNFFLGRLMTEKLLLVLFIALGAAIRASRIASASTGLWREHKVLKSTLDIQARWLASRTEIEAKAQKAIGQLEPSRTLNDASLFREVNAIANSVGLGKS